MKKTLFGFLLAFSKLCFAQTDTIISNALLDTGAVISGNAPDSFNLKSDEVQLSIFPNPTSANATLQLNLKNAQYLIIDLADLNGNIIRTIASKMFNNLKQSIFIETYGLAKGSYLISVKSEGGNIISSIELKIAR